MHEMETFMLKLCMVPFQKKKKKKNIYILEKSPVQTFAIKLEAHNSLEYHYMLKH